MPINAMSGQYGAVNGRTTVRDWMINSFTDLRRYATSNTRGAYDRMRGNYDWNGRFRTFGDWPNMVMPGEYFQFTGYQGAPTEVYGDPGPNVFGPAIVDSVEVLWDWVANDPVSVTHIFSGNGLLDDGADASYVDQTAPDTVTAENCYFKTRNWTAGTSQTDVCARRVTLTFRSENKPYVNSCSNGIVKRSSGILDWTMAVVMEQPDTANLPFKEGDVLTIDLQVNALSNGFFELAYGIVRGFSDFVVNIETGDIIQYTINIEMAATDDSGAIGHIKLPNYSGNYWPPTTGTGTAAAVGVMVDAEGQPRKVWRPDDRLAFPLGTQADPAVITPKSS